MNPSANAPARFRRLLAESDTLVIPGVYNALFARVMQDAGFPCVYMSGFAVAASMLGNPDLGVLGLAEMAGQARRIVSAVDVPVLADADTGYGGVFSIRRTVEEYEDAGLAGLHIEDQDLTAKGCGWLSDIKVISPESMLRNLRAALRARRNENFFIIARTDARRTLGFEEALRRAELYAEQGADAVFVEYLTDITEIRRVVEAVRVPVVVVVVEGEQMLSVEALKTAGVRIVLFAISVLNATVAAAEKVGLELHRAGTTHSLIKQMVNPKNLLKYTRLDEMVAWESALRK